MFQRWFNLLRWSELREAGFGIETIFTVSVLFHRRNETWFLFFSSLELLQNLYSSGNEKLIETTVSVPTPATKCMNCSNRGRIHCRTEPEECAKCEYECKSCIAGSACLSDICDVWYQYEIFNNPYYKNRQMKCGLRCRAKDCYFWDERVPCSFGEGCFSNIPHFPRLHRHYLSKQTSLNSGNSTSQTSKPSRANKPASFRSKYPKAGKRCKRACPAAGFECKKIDGASPSIYTGFIPACCQNEEGACQEP